MHVELELRGRMCAVGGAVSGGVVVEGPEEEEELVVDLDVDVDVDVDTESAEDMESVGVRNVVWDVDVMVDVELGRESKLYGGILCEVCVY